MLTRWHIFCTPAFHPTNLDNVCWNNTCTAAQCTMYTCPDEAVKAWLPQDRWNSSGTTHHGTNWHKFPQPVQLLRTPKGSYLPTDENFESLGSHCCLRNESPGVDCETSHPAQMQKSLAACKTWKSTRGRHWCWQKLEATSLKVAL